MVDSAVMEKAKAVLAEEFEVDATDIKMDANLIETLDLDSLDFVDIVVLLEAEFGIKVDNKEEFRNIITFQDLYNYIDTKLNEKGEA